MLMNHRFHAIETALYWLNCFRRWNQLSEYFWIFLDSTNFVKLFIHNHISAPNLICFHYMVINMTCKPNNKFN